MERQLLKPRELSVSQNFPNSEITFKDWLRTVRNFIEGLSKLRTADQLGYRDIKPDPRRLQALLDLPPPTATKELKRVNGVFAYYSKWIENFSEKVSALLRSTFFSLADKALKAFDSSNLHCQSPARALLKTIYLLKFRQTLPMFL